MANSPPESPMGTPRPMSAMMKAARSNSRMSTASKNGVTSRFSDEDSKTSVKVVVRVRPPLNPTDPGFDLIPQRFQRSMVQVTSPTSLAIDSPQGRKLFVFDRVFGEDVTQEGLWDYLVESTNAFVQGYNVSVLAYGQSGAGKSYTMGTSGPMEQADMDIMGVIPRAATALFEKLEGPKPPSNRASMSGLRTPQRYSQIMTPTVKSADRGWTLKATYLEIYNEQLRDLLVPEHIPLHERGQVTIREDTKGHILFTGLHQVEINSVEDLLGALNFGSTIRQTDSTNINAKSSRSHAVFSLNLVQRKAKSAPEAQKRFSVPLEAMSGSGSEGWATFDSKLHFVDLAGSERLKNTGAQGERAKEGISINAGLASLGKVISQLSSRQPGSHVSYRDSKLTRLLQDSLGGNAITYMIACVTPAEFHLSETLNTVQYAQRARAIQSKPQIQQVSDENDKQALIDALKAEVIYLREKLRLSGPERNVERRMVTQNERPERQQERDFELQNQLLDVQENYASLCQRHAKLISELAKARDNEMTGNQTLEGTIVDNATERLKRSNFFAEAVEQVIQEYEKTIQSLELSLSSTRSTLSTTETMLLERDSKTIYTETINQQLQARLQKMLDRESSTETYLQDLETKLDTHSSGEEKNSAIISELRKEITRVRENESTCEDYISVLEERLAESDQDSENMRREIERLEHVIERQRGLGKLDNLLYELDHIQIDPALSPKAIPLASGISDKKGDPWAHSRKQSLASRRSRNDVILENGRGEYEAECAERALVQSPTRSETEGPEDNGEDIESEKLPIQTPLETVREHEYPPTSPAQSKFVHDKLENVTQELFELRVEHESTINDYDLLSAKYDEALRALAELKDNIDEARHSSTRDSVTSTSSRMQTRPISFLPEAGVSGPYSPSRSLLSELSSAGETDIASIMETFDVDIPLKQAGLDVTVVPEPNADIVAELESLKKLALEKDEAQQQLVKKYEELAAQHTETEDLVEELKTHLARSRMSDQLSKANSPNIRRKSSQNVLMVDKAHRSFASLRNIGTEHFEGNPDVMQAFELNLNSAMHELYSRSERVQELEADNAAVKKEMETKMTIISGLTRERSSIRNSSPMDISVVATMRDQLMRSENQVRILQETHGVREKELQAEIASLRSKADAQAQSITTDEARSKELNDEQNAAQEKRIADLETELQSWEERHMIALQTMQASEKKLLSTIAEMATRTVAPAQSSKNIHGDDRRDMEDTDEELEDNDHELNAKHQELVEILQRELEVHRTAVTTNATRVAEFEAAHALTRTQLDETIRSRDASSAETAQHRELISKLEQQFAEASAIADASVAENTEHKNLILKLEQEVANASSIANTSTEENAKHKELVSRLEQQIADHELVVKSHEGELRNLKDKLAKDTEEITAAAAADYESHIQEIRAEYENTLNAKQLELDVAREKVTSIASHVSAALGVEVGSDKIEDRIAMLAKENQALAGLQDKTGEMQQHVVEMSKINEEIMRELEFVKTELAGILDQKSDGPTAKVTTIADQMVIVKQKIKDLEASNDKSTRLVDELEEQLAANFDQHQMAHNRLSTLQTERNTALDEAQANHAKVLSELEAVKEEYMNLQARYDDGVLADANGARRSDPKEHHKGSSVGLLPSPPPAMPLPPLPSSIGGALGSPTKTSSRAPTPPTVNRPASRDVQQQQILEDQEARLRTIEKHLFAEKQLTSTLEEALTDLERQSNKVKADCDAWRRRAGDLEIELKDSRDREEREKREGGDRWSMNVVEEERRKRAEAEKARSKLEERMNSIAKKKKKGSLNCF